MLRLLLLGLLLPLPLALPCAAAAPVAALQPDTTRAGAQPDTVWASPSATRASVALAPVVVTATRTRKELEDVAVPMTVVPAEEIERQGAVRLGDVLAAVPGLHLFDDHGTGLQVQGFAPDYTLILIDGQPVIGRTAGTLDLDRITVQGVERVELVRGPSSSLYGSEALAGVVNVITSQPRDGWRGGLHVRGGSFETSDLNADVQAGFARGGARLLVNRFASGGYDLAPDEFGDTAPAFQDWTTDLRAHADLTDRLTLRLGVRAARQDQERAGFLLDADRAEVRYDERARRTDWSVHPEALLRLSERVRLRTTLYGARYQTETRFRAQDDGRVLFDDDFDQRLARAEVQADALWGPRHLSVVGAGVTDERLASSRYDFQGAQPTAQQAFAFAQHEWTPSRLIELSASARFDAHSDYAAQLSPKLSLLVRPADAVRLRASVGSGFKAPDFRQLYLNFSNAAGGGYAVLGSARLQAGLQRFIDDGLVRPEDVFLSLDVLEPIRAESSVAFNVGGTVAPWPWLSATVNLFHNDVEDLIETQIVAQKRSGASVFSYYNVASVYTRGVEAEATVRPLGAVGLDAAGHDVEVELGYQFLQARDRSVVEALEGGTVFGRGLDGRDVRLGVGDYGGLFGRSPHSATLQATHTHEPLGLTTSLRARYRSDYGYADFDGNQIANRPDEFVGGYTVVDATVTKTVPAPGDTQATLQLGIDNAFDVTRGPLVPSLPGRRLYAALRLSL